MSLTWRDAIATLLVGVAVIITYARVKGLNWPLLSSWRMGIIVLLVLGLGTCIVVGSGGVPAKNSWTTISAGLGMLAFMLALVGLIINSRVMFLALAADIVVLWVISTLRHIVTTTA